MQKVVQLLRIKRFLKAGKLSFIFLPLVLILSSSQTNGQDILDKKINLHQRGASIKEALMDVQKQSGVKIIYGESINRYPEVTITAQIDNITVRNAIELILKKTHLQYESMGTHVMITENIPNATAGQGINSGSLKGRIVEFETSQPLSGATVSIPELNKGIAADNNGYYQLTGIPLGRYILKVSFIGYTTETPTVEIKSGRETTYDVKLQGSNQLNEVVVNSLMKTRRPVAHTSEKQVLEEIKNAQSVVSGISSEQISKSADRNAAEVVRRVSGVTIRDDKFVVIRGMNERYNLTYLNNNIAPSTELYSRAFSLDLVPSRIIDRILIYKSPAPDLLADMTGGAVKIFTKDAKNVKHFDIELQTGYRENTTFNPNVLTYKGGKLDFLGFDDGTRKLPSSVPGFGDFSKAQISQQEYAKTFNTTLNYYRKQALPLIQLTANYYNSFRLWGKDLSMLSSLSYKNEPLHLDIDRAQGNISIDNSNYGTKLSKMGVESQNTQTVQISLLQNFTYHLKDSSTVYFKNFLLQQGQNATILQNYRTNLIYNGDDMQWENDRGEYPNSPDLRNIVLSYTQRFLYSGNAGGSHYPGRIAGRQKLDWNAGLTYSRLSIPDQRAIHLQNSLQGNLAGRIPGAADYEQNWTPVVRDLSLDNIDNKVDLGMISRLWTRNTEKVYNASADYTYKWKPWVTVKAGTYQQWKERMVFRRVYTVNEGDLNSTGQPSDLGGIGESVPGGMDYNIVFFHEQDLNKVWSSQYLRDNSTGLKVFDRTSGADTYTASEQNNSGYVAVSLLPFNGKLDIYGGLRVEYNRQQIAGALPPSSSSLADAGATNTPVYADLKATSLLPSVNIGYRPANSLVFRLAYGKTVNRPEFRELAPYSELDYINNQKVIGNSELVFAQVDNFDARLEWYPNANAKGESISIGGFYKNIDHPIERVVYSDLNYALVANVTYANARQATVKGLELDIRKNFDFIPLNFFRDLSLIANGALYASHASGVTGSVPAIPGDLLIHNVIDRQLQGQSPYSVNIGLYYENAGLGTRVAVIGNQVGPRIYAASIGYKALPNSTGINPGSQGSLLELTRQQLDLAITQRIIKSLQAKFSVQNLLNSPIQVAEDANFTYKYEKPVLSGRSVTGDLLSTDYKPGRYLLLTITYSF